jgi:hypothetical protein
MAKLEDLKRNAQVRGLNPSGPVTILNVQTHGADVVEVTYRDVNGKDYSELLFRDREPDLELIEAGVPWAFDRLAFGARSIRSTYPASFPRIRGTRSYPHGAGRGTHCR